MADFVIHINEDEQYVTEMQRAGDKLVVVDFFATWCGPCQRIAPVYGQLSVKYRSSAVFLKVDVDQCQATAAANAVTAMPTFMFFKRGVKVGEMKGADPVGLEENIKRHSGAEPAGASGPIPGHSDLVDFISKNQVEVLNESDDHTKSALFADDTSYLESDCDEQLMITIPFNQPVKIHSFKLVAPSDGSAPKDIKVFINMPNPPSFDEAETLACTQQFTLTAKDVSGDNYINLMFVRFQNVSSITMFVHNNQGDTDTTKIRYLELIGSPVASTNMNEFKRVAGKAGESHG